MTRSTDRPDCGLIQELLLKRAREQRLSEEESRLVRDHAAACPDCGEEARLFGLLSLRSDADSPLGPDEESRKNQVVASAVDAFMSGRRDGRSPEAAASVQRRWAPVAAAAAAVLLLVVAIQLIRLAGRESPATAADLVVTRVEGDARAGASTLAKGAAVTAGDRLTTGAGAFLALSGGEGCSLFLLGGTSVVVGRQGGDLREFELGEGVLAARTGGGRTPCRLAVRAGDVTAFNRGTLFSVERNGDVRIVSVVEGTVVVASSAGKKWTARAGEKMTVGPSGVAAAPLTTREADVVRTAAGGRGEPAPVQEEMAGTETTPETGVDEGEKAGAKKAHAGAGEPGASALLKKAREMRKNEDWDGAVKTFGEIMKLFPDSSEAKIAVISLGEIYLENKADPARALTYFKAYKAANPEGSLFEEASYGVIRCYRKMGQTGKEADEIRQFLEKFPDDIYGKKLKERLEELQAEKQP